MRRTEHSRINMVRITLVVNLSKSRPYRVYIDPGVVGDVFILLVAAQQGEIEGCGLTLALTISRLLLQGPRIVKICH